ncbi:preprotein translocase subunit SecE [Candidatus Saccharibacteria bacterium]|nr:preprotein translocase subunit SecE [Candidatus Saccharibacteria bacterium]
MAKNDNKGTVVRRVKASSADSSVTKTDEPAATKRTAAKKKTAKTASQAVKTAKPTKTTRKNEKSFFLFRPIFAIGRYFRNSWRELRQVRWTNRRSTWALTLAVILFCLFFAGLIMLVDWIFDWTIKEVIL